MSKMKAIKAYNKMTRPYKREKFKKKPLETSITIKISYQSKRHNSQRRSIASGSKFLTSNIISVFFLQPRFGIIQVREVKASQTTERIKTPERQRFLCGTDCLLILYKIIISLNSSLCCVL